MKCVAMHFKIVGIRSPCLAVEVEFTTLHQTLRDIFTFNCYVWSL